MNRIGQRWIVAAIAAALLAGGCGMNQADMDSNSSRSSSEEEFAAGRNRPPSRNTMFALANLLASQGHDQESSVVLTRIIRQDPDFIPAYSLLAELQMRNNHVDEAIGVLNVALDREPDDAALLNNVGMCHIFRKDYPEALRWFTRAAASDATDARYRANMAMTLGMMGRYEESLTLYLQVAPPAEAHFNVAVLSEARKDIFRAMREYDQAQALDPKIRH
jgi:Tfp pilus assembly protein PilF